MLYNPPSGSTDANAPYVGKNVAAGTQGSKVPPAAVEYPQREWVALIAASGQAPTNNILVQGAIALGRGIWVDNLTGTGDLAVATLGVVLPSFLKGMRIGGVATATNTVTNPKLRVVNLGSVGGYTDFPIIKEDGSALAAGDIVAGRRYRYEADGAGNVMISGGGIGSTSRTSVVKAAKALYNVQPYRNPTRTTLTGPGDGATWVNYASGTITKVSGTSRLKAEMSIPLWSPGPAAPTKVRLVVAGQTIRGVTQYSFGANVYGQLRLDDVLMGLAAGSLAWTLDFSRPNDGNTWYATANPTSADSQFFDPAGTATAGLFSEFEP